MRKYLDRAKGVLIRANVALGFFMGLFILVIDFLVVYETVARYGFNQPPIWVLEVTSYLLLYIVFLAAAYTLQEGGHVRVEFGMSYLPQEARRIILVLADILALGFCSVLLWQSTRFTLMAFQGSWKSTTPLAIPIHYISVVIPIGALLLCLTYLLKVFGTIWPIRSGPPGGR
jgi:TRAP-type C4-dicarboxylate transport system permease small subunit